MATYVVTRTFETIITAENEDCAIALAISEFANDGIWSAEKVSE